MLFTIFLLFSLPTHARRDPDLIRSIKHSNLPHLNPRPKMKFRPSTDYEQSVYCKTDEKTGEIVVHMNYERWYKLSSSEKLRVFCEEMPYCGKERGRINCKKEEKKI